MKTLDPPSTVREGEAATVENARGIPDGLRNMYNKVVAGTKLGDDQRKTFTETADVLYKAELEGYIGNINRFKTASDNMDLSSENIFGNIFFDNIKDARSANHQPGTLVYIDYTYTK